MSLSQKCSWREFGLFHSLFTFSLIAVAFFSGWLAASARAADVQTSSTNIAAELSFKNELVRQKKLHGESSVEVAQTLDEYGVFLVSSTQFSRAEAVFREALALRKQLLGSNHRETVDSLINVLIVLEKQGKHADAEPLLLEAIEPFQRDPKQSADQKRAAIKRVRDFYIDWAVAAPGTGKMAKSAEWSWKFVDFDETALAPESVPKEN